MNSLVVVVLGFALVSGCLKTRNEVKDTEQKQVMQQQMVSLQKNTADTGNRFSDIEEQMRYLSGRVESLENKMGRDNQESGRQQKSQSDSIQEINKKMQIYQESLLKMESQIQALQSELGQARQEAAANAKSAAVDSSSKSKSAPKNGYEAGEELFKQKDWKAAIIEYQKYRDKFPQGKSFADATYKIGVCFQEIGMRDDAKIFYQEVVSRFPNSEEARRSKTRMKSLK